MKDKLIEDLTNEQTDLGIKKKKQEAICEDLKRDILYIDECRLKVLTITTPIKNCNDLLPVQKLSDGVGGDETCVETSTFQDFVRQAEALLEANPDLLSTPPPKQFKIGTDGGGRSRHNRKAVPTNVSTRSRRTIPAKVVDAVPKKVPKKVPNRSRRNAAKVVVPSKKTTDRSRKVQQILDALPQKVGKLTRSPKAQQKSPPNKQAAARRSPRGRRSSSDGSSDLTFVNTSYTPFNTCKVFKAL